MSSVTHSPQAMEGKGFLRTTAILAMGRLDAISLDKNRNVFATKTFSRINK